MRRIRIPAGLTDLSRRGFGRVLVVTLVGTLGTMLVSLLTVGYTTQFMNDGARALSFLAAVILPLILSGPIFYIFAAKLRQLAVAHHELAVIASRDSLTTVLNRGAFITLVDAYLAEVRAYRAAAFGGLLVMDADHFKLVNDRFGHASGDTALKLIADGIREGLRGTDLVGRVGGEEFAVFLPGADPGEARAVAERICNQVHGIDFRPTGTRLPLSISIGGATFDGPITFTELFRAADVRLYAAKEAGRDRVEIGAVAAMAAHEPRGRLAVNL